MLDCNNEYDDDKHYIHAALKPVQSSATDNLEKSKRNGFCVTSLLDISIIPFVSEVSPRFPEDYGGESASASFVKKSLRMKHNLLMKWSARGTEALLNGIIMEAG